MASPLVLQGYAQDVWEGSHSGEAADAKARFGVGRYSHGSRLKPKAPSVLALHSVGKGADSCASGLSVLSGH